MITPAQIRAARALLGWSPDELAEPSGVSKPTIVRFEAAEERVAEGGYAGTRDKLVTALKGAGVLFSADSDGETGVRLKKTRTGTYARREFERQQ